VQGKDFSDFLINREWKVLEYESASIGLAIYLILYVALYEPLYKGVNKYGLAVDADDYSVAYFLCVTSIQIVALSLIGFRKLNGLRITSSCWEKLILHLNEEQKLRSLTSGKEVYRRKNMIEFKFFSSILLVGIPIVLYLSYEIIFQARTIEPVSLELLYLTVTFSAIPSLVMLLSKVAICKLRSGDLP
jgi:hypothetical protein